MAKREQVEVLRMAFLKDKKNAVKALCAVRVDDIGFDGVKVIEGKDGLFVAFPSHEGKDEKGKDEKGKKTYYANIWCDCGDKDDTKDLYKLIERTVLDYYDDKK